MTTIKDVLSHLHKTTSNDDLNFQKQFNAILIDTMKSINANTNHEKGIWYVEEYREYCSQTSKSFSNELYFGCADNAFWDVIDKLTFKIKPGKKPSEAVNAFINGLTIADCGNVIVICQLVALMKTLGTEKFDAIFSIKPLTIHQTPMDEGDTSSFFFDFGDTKDIPTEGIVGHRPIREGEICYIESLAEYAIKHPGGFGGGFNVICVGQNEQGEDLLLGFHPELFKKGPLTEKELFAHFIDAYNLDRNRFDKKLISERDASDYDMKMQDVPKTITFEKGFKKIKGYLPGSVVIPLYSRIRQYQSMNASEISDSFSKEYANFLFQKANDLLFSYSTSLSLKPASSKSEDYYFTSENDPEKIKEGYESFKATPTIESLPNNVFGWTRDGKRYVYKNGEMYKSLPSKDGLWDLAAMTSEEINEFEQGLKSQFPQFKCKTPFESTAKPSPSSANPVCSKSKLYGLPMSIEPFKFFKGIPVINPFGMKRDEPYTIEGNIYKHYKNQRKNILSRPSNADDIAMAPKAKK